MSREHSPRMLTQADLLRFRTMEAQALPKRGPERGPKGLLAAAIAVLLVLFGACSALPQGVQATTGYVHRAVSSAVSTLASTQQLAQAVAPLASTQQLAQAVAGLASTNFVAQSISEIPPPAPEDDPVALPVAQAAATAVTNEASARAAGDAATLSNAVADASTKYVAVTGGTMAATATLAIGSKVALAGNTLYFPSTDGPHPVWASYGPGAFSIGCDDPASLQQYQGTQVDVGFASGGGCTFYWPDESGGGFMARTIATREYSDATYQPLGPYLETEADPVALPVAQTALAAGTNAQAAVEAEALARQGGDAATLSNAVAQAQLAAGASGALAVAQSATAAALLYQAKGQYLTATNNATITPPFSTSASGLFVDMGLTAIDTAGAFVVRVPTNGAGRAFSLLAGTQSTGWASFERHAGGTGKPGFALGSGVAARDASVFRESAGTVGISTNLKVFGTVTAGSFAGDGSALSGVASTAQAQAIAGATGAVVRAQAASDAAALYYPLSNPSNHLTAAWAATGTVSRSVAAQMLASPNGKAWVEVGTNGVAYLVQVTNTVHAYVSAAVGEGYDGPSVGTVWTGPPAFGDNKWSWPLTDGWVLSEDEVNEAEFEEGGYWSLAFGGNPWGRGNIGTTHMPVTFAGGEGVDGATGTGTVTVDWVPSTNAFEIVTEPTVISIVDAHNSDGEAHPTLARQADLAGYVPTNAIPGPGCTLLSGVAPTVTGATVNYLFTPTNAYTLAVLTNAPRYNYSVEVIGTNAYTFGTGITQRGEWTPGGTNLVVLVPCTGAVWRAYGRAF